MERHELNRMFDGLTPDPQQEWEMLKKLLQDGARRKKPMKNWKQIVAGAAAAALLVIDRSIFARVDYSLLLTFVGFFIFTGNMGRLPAVSELLQAVVSGNELIAGVAVSQVISNVPAALLLSGFTDDFAALLTGVNLGGLGTLIASMAGHVEFTGRSFQVKPVLDIQGDVDFSTGDINFIGDINPLTPAVVQELNQAGGSVDPAAHNYIRLERIHVNAEPKPGNAVLEGTVESREYYGLYIKYYITVDGQTIKVIEKNDGVNIYEAGQKVQVIMDPRDVMAYPAAAQQ